VITLVNQSPVMLGAEFLAGANLTAIVISVVSGGALTAWISWFVSRRKQSAETEGIVADTYSQVLSDMRAELTRYQQMLESSNKRISILEAGERWSQQRIVQLTMALNDAHINIPEALPLNSHSLWGNPQGNEGEQ